MNRPDLQLRPINSILDRFERRRSNQRAEFPPDFLHGDATVSEIYETFGEEWVHNTVFVQHRCDERGRAVAVSVASFDDWFLTVEHRTIEEGETAASLKEWLRERIGTRRTVIELRTVAMDAIGIDSPRWIDLNCSNRRLRELERQVLGVVRDGADDWGTVAQTDLLSVITLCARLGVSRLH
jgi:hypothetical protein